MVSDVMSSLRAVRREDLFRDAAAEDDSAIRNAEAKDDEAAAAARAELDAYMERMLGLAAYIPAPRPAKSKPPAALVVKPMTKKADDDKDSDSDSDSDDTAQNHKPPQPKTTEFAFRLFSAHGKAPAAAVANETAAPTVVLDDAAADDPAMLGPGAILGPPRPLSHYLTGPLSDEARARYAQTAVEGADIVAQASPAVRNAWGLEVQWRARTVVQADKAALRALLTNALAPGQPAPTNLPAALAVAVNALPAWAGGSPPAAAELPGASSAGPRKRPGKRQRIILRRREKARREAEAAAAAKAQSKQEQLSEKKKRLNRLKKLRRRQQAKAAKAGGGGDGGPGSVAESGNDSGDDGGAA